jgi:aldehyde:ferredoxin oxidoreductase
MEQENGGYWQKILRIDLTNSNISYEQLETRDYRVYMGGRNLALHFLINELNPGIDPLGPENKIVITTSVLTGTPISGQGRHTTAALSPLTGGLADSQCGGWWGAELKFCGLDGIVIEGKAPNPSYLMIKDDQVEVFDASDIWGKTTGDAQDILHEKHGDNIRILQCGPAGEKLVKFANITADLRNFHGRGGLGAVMGSKNLRAICLLGTNRKIKIADREKFSEIAKWFAKSTKGHPAIELHHELGTSKGIMPVSVQGILPTYNFQDGSFEGAQELSGENMKAVLNGTSETCFGCAVSCKRSVEGSRNGFKVTRKYGGPEYESIGLLGSVLGVDDVVAMAQANELCNALGLDTISTGATLGWAIESYKRELITKEDTQGLELDWNTPRQNLEMIELIAKRKGFGDILAEGSLKAATRLNKESIKYAMQVKGQELPNHEPRGKWGVALGYAVSPTGADHLQAAHDPWFTKPGDYSTERNWVDLEDLSPVGLIDPVPAESLSPEKVRLFTYLQFIWGFHDVLDWCIFTAVPEFRAISLKQLVEILNSVTGWRCSLFDLMKAGERGVSMARAFNVKFGFTAADDKIPERFFEPMRNGTLKGHKIDKDEFNNAVQLYYGMMGWDKNGVPTRAKLEELNVGWVWEKMNVDQ